ncbi:MAG: response regulator, partial [Bacteroidetes bacterium]|nr:response regulator [Bacteroidota bacterium]
VDKIFDPYFTTKKQGKGTGMGLSVVHGIIKKAGGSIHLYNKPGRGTEFHVYLPVVQSSLEPQGTQTTEPIQGGTERILLVDDEDAIVFMEKQMLERLGYSVVSRTSSVESLEAFRANPEIFDLVITDMSMPNMTGDRLASELVKILPDIPILLCTGFSEKMPEEKAEAMSIKGFLMKPITIKDLSEKIREVLDNKKGAGEG